MLSLMAEKKKTQAGGVDEADNSHWLEKHIQENKVWDKRGEGEEIVDLMDGGMKYEFNWGRSETESE